MITPSLIKNRKILKSKKIITAETSNKLSKILRKVVHSKNGTASLADKDGYYVGGKTGTAESYGDKKSRINTFISIFPANKPRFTLFVMLENPSINKDLIYNWGIRLQHLTTRRVRFCLCCRQNNRKNRANFSHK